MKLKEFQFCIKKKVIFAKRFDMKYYFKSEFEITEEFKDVNGDLIDIRNIKRILFNN